MIVDLLHEAFVSFVSGGAAAGLLRQLWSIVSAVRSGELAEADRRARELELVDRKQRADSDDLWRRLTEERDQIASDLREERRRCRQLEEDCHRHLETARGWEQSAHELWHPMNNAIQRYNSLLDQMRAAHDPIRLAELLTTLAVCERMEPPLRLATFDKVRGST
jgi:hypothetical protein